MFNDTLNRAGRIGRTVALVLGFAAMFPSLGHTQAPPMDMSWAIRAQAQYQAHGDAAARNAAMTYYRYMQQLRAAGYTGPSLPTGVTPESLQRSINAANQAGQAYNAAQFANSQRRYNTAVDYDMRAIRGCTRYINQWGQVAYGGC
ncbi:MAG TPA: hypothetical protein VHZ01_02140 [Casimicrobiaceae bacterium]|jgi:hypothetical protein|nr:hypothetical protein [Casimicrobiaceae bacterium]